MVASMAASPSGSMVSDSGTSWPPETSSDEVALSVPVIGPSAKPSLRLSVEKSLGKTSRNAAYCAPVPEKVSVPPAAS